jgi:hypothetical protein
MAQYPIYNTRGEWAAMLIDVFLYNARGEWAGYISKNGHVFSVMGKYVGWLSKDFRILRKKVQDQTIPACPPPVQPPLKVRMPDHVPLPPLMANLPFDTFDVMEDEPERLHPLNEDPDAADMD